VLIVPARTQVISQDESFEVVIADNSEAKSLTKVSAEFSTGDQTESAFLNSVELALKAIDSGEIEKVVLARDLVLPITGAPDLGLALRRLHERYPDCWTYKVGNVFGATPEILLRARNGEVSARVLAGTAARGTDPDVDVAIADGLSHSLKNKHEHDFAVQSLVRELSPFCSTVDYKKEPFSLVLPDLWHLATDVTGKLLPNITLFDVIEKLHPTAAVAGTPTIAATALLEELEPFDRGGYAGPVGWLSSNGSGEIAIALRGGVIEENQIRAIAGSGIVAESIPEAELVETELKFRAVRWAFQSTN
jgi:menaquinone-specific isochorismate synthase